MTHSTSIHPGQRLGRYEMIRPIARGGMATVWAARLMGPRGFQKIVAVKVMLSSLRDEPGVEEMFLAEARVASLIRHPNVVEVMDLGDEGGCLHIAMEWVHGAPLTTVLTAAASQGGMGITIAARIARQVSLGLAAAHALTDENGKPLGLVHRDVSPHNVLAGFNGVIKVTDFGIAKVRDASESKTEFGQIKGKLAYMAPEQLRFEAVDQRTDVFAVGILLYLMTTGVHPFKGADQHETARAILSPDPPPLPSTLIQNYPPRLERVVMTALQKSPDRRQATANELAAELAGAMPPTSKSDGIQEYLRELLPVEYEQGIDLARAAMETGRAKNASGNYGAQPKSSATLRAVAVSSDSADARAARPTVAPDRTPVTARPSRRAGKIIASVAALALAGGAAVGLSILSVRHHDNSPAAAASSVTTPPEPEIPEPAAPAKPEERAAETAPEAARPTEAAPAVPAPEAAKVAPRPATPVAARPAPHVMAPAPASAPARPIAPKKAAPAAPATQTDLKDPYGM